MARYRTYRNGITGCRYKDCYILKGDKKGEFSILAKDGSPLKAGVYDFEDCQWEIDKMTATQEERAQMEGLYNKQFYELAIILADLGEKAAAGRLTPKEDALMQIAMTVRSRKAKDRPF